MLRFSFFIFFFVVINAYGQVVAPLNKDWHFLRQDIGGIWEAYRSAPKGSSESVPIWESIDVPHSYNAYDAVTPGVSYYQGPSWYRKYVSVNNPYTNGRTILHFEGVGQKTDLYIGRKKVYSHVGGYDEWKVDITDELLAYFCDSSFVNFNKGKVPILLRVDNSRDLEMIPSDLSDFNLYGGIYRDVNLIYTPSFYIDKVFVDTKVLNDKALLSTRLALLQTQLNKKLKINYELVDARSKSIHRHSFTKMSDSNNFVIALPTIEIIDPQLWSTISPYLYKFNVQAISGNDTVFIESNIGFREFEFVKNGPFKLNGERLLLRGTHRHEDHAGVGPAMSKDQIWTEMTLMKNMGVNFIRLGHYQQSKYVLDACDKLGILVWEEIPWCRGGLGGENYKEQARRMLKNMIEQHYNHPSIIIWGLGNENDWNGDFESFEQDSIRAFMLELHDLSHQMDDSRKTAIRRCDFCKDIVDVYSPSIWAGWYRGVYTDYKEVSRKEFERVNHFLHVEWGGDSHARRHSENPDNGLAQIIGSSSADERAGDASLYGGSARVSKDGDWSESYMVNLIDWHLKEQETMPWLTGTAYWPFKDFSTPVRPDNPVPYMNQKGVVERDFNKKESYYVFQSYWTNKLMARIYGHTWDIRWGDKGQKRMVKVYSNGESAELFHNGVSLGVKTRDSQDFPAAGLRWMVSFVEGDNNLKVIARLRNEFVVDSLTQQYQTVKWTKPVSLDLTVKEILGDTILVQAYLLDEFGVKCLDADDFINFACVGDGYLIKDQGTSSGSTRVQAYNGRAEIRFVRTGNNAVVSVRGDKLRSVLLNLSQ